MMLQSPQMSSWYISDRSFKREYHLAPNLIGTKLCLRIQSTTPLYYTLLDDCNEAWLLQFAIPDLSLKWAILCYLFFYIGNKKIYCLCC